MRACGDAARPWPSPGQISNWPGGAFSIPRHDSSPPPAAGFKKKRGGGARSNSGNDTHGEQIDGGCLRAAIVRRACVQAGGVRGRVGGRGVGAVT